MADRSMTGPPSAGSNHDTVKKRLPSVQYRFLRSLAGSICVAGLFTLIFWQILIALIGYPQFHVQTLTVSNFNVPSSSRYTGTWDTHIIVQNPNWKATVYCDDIVVVVLHNLCSWSETCTLPFMHVTKNQTAIRARSNLQVHAFGCDQDGVTREKNTQGVINFKVRVWMTIRVQPIAWGVGQRKLRVSCHDLPVAVSPKTNSGALIGGPMECIVDSDDWFVGDPDPKTYFGIDD